MFTWTGLDDILELCKQPQNQDVTIICQNGKLNVNNFLLSAMFPVLGSCKVKETVVIIPDSYIKDIEHFFNSILSKSKVVKVKRCLHHLLEKSLLLDFKEEDDNIVVNSDNEDYDVIDSCYVDWKEEQEIETSSKIHLDENVIKISLKKRRKQNPKPKYQCSQCPQLCLTKIRLAAHIKHKHTVREIKKHVCSLCGYETRQLKGYQRHMDAMHLDSDREKCNKCKKVYNKSEKESHKCVMYTCEACGSQFNSLAIVKKHYQNVHQKGMFVFTCEKCGAICDSEAQLKDHKKIKHSGQVHLCQHCDKQFPIITLLKTHLKTHEKKYKCQICEKEVRKLEQHIQIMHTDEKDMKIRCSTCGKGFINKMQLRRHEMNVHLKQKPYECRFGCKIRYNDSSNRNAHEKKTHGQIFQT